MRILLLGGDGFIGYHLLIKHLLLSNSVVVVDLHNVRTTPKDSRYDFIKKDLSINTFEQVSKLVKHYKPDLVYNCVAIANPDFYVKFPLETFNLDFSINYEIIKALISCNVPFVHFSTSEVYGKRWVDTYTEDHTDLIIGPTHKPRWIYATSKILLEQLIKSHSADCCIIRPQNFCDWNLDWLPDVTTNTNKRWIPRLPACILNSLFTNQPINIVLPGTQQRCYTYIDDAIQALICVEENWSKCTKQTLNIGNPENEITILDFAIKMRNTWNTLVSNEKKHTADMNFISGTQLYGVGYEDCERRLFSIDKINKLTHWSPVFDIDSTVNKLVQGAIENYKFVL